ncbi:MAG: hemin uptake protein HemP [Pseudomonadota bacterium]
MPPAEDKPVYEALHLTNGGVTANIVHLGQAYTLRITRQGKLILTK